MRLVLKPKIKIIKILTSLVSNHVIKFEKELNKEYFNIINLIFFLLQKLLSNINLQKNNILLRIKN